jgi:N-acetylmuramoyl-L-alanine amidase
VVGKIDTGLWEGGEKLVLPMSRAAAFRIIPRMNPSHLAVQVFDSALDSAACGETKGRYLLSNIKPSTPGAGWTQVDLDVKAPALLGYMAHYEDGKSLVVEVKEGLADSRVEGKIICLDPGHGGPDSGAIGSGGTMEKTVNLAVGKRTAELLRRAGAEVVMTHDTDRQVGPEGCNQAQELEARVQVGIKAGADLFLSIHNNCAGGNCSIGGTEAYYYSAFSKPLAADILDAVSYALGSKRRWVNPAVFHILRCTDCPRALVECLYISNPAEEQEMAKPQFVERAAEGIIGGIRQYLEYAAGTSKGQPRGSAPIPAGAAGP